VEACEVFFARAGVELDFLGRGDGDLALLGGRRHNGGSSKVCGRWMVERVVAVAACASYDAELENCCRDLGFGRFRARLTELKCPALWHGILTSLLAKEVNEACSLQHK
jgi:hypothetical protein